MSSDHDFFASLAFRVRCWVEDQGALDRFRAMLRQVEADGLRNDILPWRESPFSFSDDPDDPLNMRYPHRVFSLAEKYVILAAIYHAFYKTPRIKIQSGRHFFPSRTGDETEWNVTALQMDLPFAARVSYVRSLAEERVDSGGAKEDEYRGRIPDSAKEYLRMVVMDVLADLRMAGCAVATESLTLPTDPQVFGQSREPEPTDDDSLVEPAMPATPDRRLPGERVIVKFDPVQIVVDGEAYALPSHDAAIFLSELLAADGMWRSGPEICAAHPELTGTRFDRLFRRIPAAVQKFVESSTAKGYRWKVELFQNGITY
jgi:hypothetical protein